MCFFRKKQKQLLEKYKAKKAEIEISAKFKNGDLVHSVPAFSTNELNR